MSDIDQFKENYKKDQVCAECDIHYSDEQSEPTTQGKWALRDRLRSRVLWAAIVGCIITVISAFDAWKYIGLDANGFREIAASVGAVMAAFGVLNDPTNREGF